MNDNSALSSVIAKIVKLRSLASNNSNENEVKAATAAADRMMQEYRISQAEIEVTDVSQAEPFIHLTVSQGGRRTSWRETLLAALVTHYGCCFYLSSRRVAGKGVQSYTVVGRESDAAIVQYMFSWLEGEITRLCRYHSGGKGIAYAKSWLQGCAGGVSRQLSELREVQRAQAAVSSAMVILDKRCNESRANMTKTVGTKKAKAVGSYSNYDGMQDGHDVGKNIKLRQGIGSNATSLALK